MATLRFDSTQVAQLANVLGHAAGVAPVEARAVVAKGALNIKKDAQGRVSGSRHFPALGASITYDTHQTATTASAEIGPEHGRRQGNMGGIVENGTPKSAPRPFMLPAGLAEEPKFVKALEDLAVKAIGL